MSKVICNLVWFDSVVFGLSVLKFDLVWSKVFLLLFGNFLLKHSLYFFGITYTNTSIMIS